MDHARHDAGLKDGSAELAEKKIELRQAVHNLDLLAPLRKHPYVTVGLAAALGITAASDSAAQTVQLAVAPRCAEG